MSVRVLPLALACLALLPQSAAAQTSDEPNVERGRIETFGPQGRLFAAEGARRFVLMSRQSYAAEHGAGFAGEFRVVDGADQRAYRYETVCASERKGYRLVRATREGAKEQEAAYSASIDERITSPKASQKAAYNLYWAACRKQFRRFR